MANVKITELTELAAIDVADNDVLPIVDVGGDTTKKITAASLKTSIAYANDFITYTQLNSNIDSVQSNVVAAEANIAGTDARLVANVSALNDVDTAINIRITNNTAVAASNDFITYTQLNSNINVVQDNVAAIDANVVSISDTGGHTVNFSANLIPSANAVYDLGSATAQWKDLYLTGSTIKLGGITISELAGEGITITGTSGEQANLTTPSLGGVANISAEIEGIDARIAANTLVAASNDYATYTRLQANIDLVQDNVATLTVGTASDTETRLNANLDVTNDNAATLTTTVDNFGTYANSTLDTKANVSATLFLARANDFATYTRLQANIDLVQDNVASVTVGTAADTETRLNANLDVTNDNVSSLTTTVDNFGTYANTNLDTKANVSATYFLALANDLATYTLINANLDIVQDNVATLTTTVDNFGTSSNANAAALALEDAALQTRLGSNVAALQARIAANALVAASNDYVTYTRLNANVNTVSSNVAAAEANIAAIIDGSTAFTGDVTMQQALTVSGNLYVAGAQVDLGIGSAQIDDATLLLAANTPGDAQLAADAGIVINRGQDANVFFGFASYGDHIDFIFTDAPADNVNHYAISYVDVHANSFGAEGTHDPTYTAVHHADRPTTGFYFPTNEIVGVIGGAYKANITASGLEAVAVYSDGVELRANDSATYLAALSNDFATYTLINANVDVVQDNVAQNATDITAVETRRTANIAGAVSTITTGNLTASRALLSDGSGKVAVSDVTSTELGYLDGVTSAIQTQLNAKQATITGAATTIDDTNLTATRALVSDGSGKVSVSTVSTTELGYVEGVTSAIQTQLDAKLASASYTAADVLTKIKTVDGSGSGLDADLLDGQSSAYYAVEATRASNAADLAAGIAAVPTGDITAVTAGSGLTGGGTSGSVTLNVGAGTGVSVAADTVSIGQAVGTGDSPTFAGLTVNGTFDLGTL